MPGSGELTKQDLETLRHGKKSVRHALLRDLTLAEAQQLLARLQQAGVPEAGLTEYLDDWRVRGKYIKRRVTYCYDIPKAEEGAHRAYSSQDEVVRYFQDAYGSVLEGRVTEEVQAHAAAMEEAEAEAAPAEAAGDPLLTQTFSLLAMLAAYRLGRGSHLRKEVALALALALARALAQAHRHAQEGAAQGPPASPTEAGPGAQAGAAAVSPRASRGGGKAGGARKAAPAGGVARKAQPAAGKGGSVLGKRKAKEAPGAAQGSRTTVKAEPQADAGAAASSPKGAGRAAGRAAGKAAAAAAQAGPSASRPASSASRSGGTGRDGPEGEGPSKRRREQRGKPEKEPALAPAAEVPEESRPERTHAKRKGQKQDRKGYKPGDVVLVRSEEPPSAEWPFRWSMAEVVLFEPAKAQEELFVNWLQPATTRTPQVWQAAWKRWPLVGEVAWADWIPEGSVICRRSSELPGGAGVLTAEARAVLQAKAPK